MNLDRPGPRSGPQDFVPKGVPGAMARVPLRVAHKPSTTSAAPISIARMDGELTL